jgi:methionine biosynthesis protein MetW
VAKIGTREYYDAYWQTGDLTCSPPLKLLELFDEYVTGDDECLDVGCGDGGTSGPWLSEHAASYKGVDVAETAVAMATARGLDAVQVADAAELPFADESFDVAVCVEVLEHLFAPQRAMAEIHRVLRPHGRLIVTVPNVAHWRSRADLAVLGRWNGRGDRLSPTQPWRDPHIRFFTVRSIRNLLEHEGYSALDVGGFSEDGFAEYVPGLRSLTRTRRAGSVGRRLGARFPMLLAGNVYAVGLVAKGAGAQSRSTP